MAGPEQKKKLGLDTNFLLDLAADKDFAHTFREVFQERGYLLVVPPTAVQELTYAATYKSAKNSNWRIAHYPACANGE